MGDSVKKNTVLGLGIVAGLVGMSLISGAAQAEPQPQLCDGVERMVCSADAVTSYRVTDQADTLTSGTLRAAIESANQSPGLDEVIIGPELTIEVLSEIEITDALILRGGGKPRDAIDDTRKH